MYQFSARPVIFHRIASRIDGSAAASREWDADFVLTRPDGFCDPKDDEPNDDGSQERTRRIIDASDGLMFFDVVIVVIST